MKYVIIVLGFLTSVSSFAGDCAGEIDKFNNAMNDLRSHSKATIEYLNNTADYIETYGNWVNNQEGKKMANGQGQTLIASSSLIRSNTNTIDSSGRGRREALVASVQAIVDCKK